MCMYTYEVQCSMYLMLFVSAEIETVFMPWLMDEAEKALEKKVLARAIVDGEFVSLHVDIA